MRVVRIVLAPVFWLGRVSLWLVFWPLGLWRSVRHGQRKRDRRMIAELRRIQQTPPPDRYDKHTGKPLF